MEFFKEILSDASAHGKSGRNRIGYLDGWRGIAIVSVLIAHFLPIKGLDWGRMGVDIFFVLSGMLMSNIIVTIQRIKNKNNFTEFYCIFRFFVHSELLSYSFDYTTRKTA